MSVKSFRIGAVFAALLTCSPFPRSFGDLITFDDVPIALSGTLSNGYNGRNWGNFILANARASDNSGYYYGMVSLSNVAFNAYGTPAEIDAAGTNFNFLSVYLTGAWMSNLNIEVKGYRSGTLLYDTTVVAAATNATLFTFNYLDIDRLYFRSFGGEYAGFGSSGEHFVMDNLSVEFVPEPSSLLLASLAALLLWPVLKRHGHRGHPVGVVGRRCEAADGVLAPSRRLVESTCRKTTFVRWLPTR